MRSVKASELAAKLEARRQAGLSRSVEVSRLIKRASEADVCFLCDATGSMQARRPARRHSAALGACSGACALARRRRFCRGSGAQAHRRGLDPRQ